ncbi:hypothetical protein [Pelagicoccus sp. SDUM812005]|uniref:hypothetical protein n=1 Tax=Pelagicoccus sp. SDUM812005 TaxID=3041257 RepID=UPI00280D68C9|nr:hypothetical protein [Pelagicoccus sp. SDUM812005]MDQ8182813.1 hypothetical protein [Pelagicoccus sp. SDUM812005]
MKRTLSLLASMAVAASINAADIRVGANITEDTTWTSDNTYILDAQVYVINDASLTIEPGTVVKGASLTGGAASLIITRGAKIFALGTPSDPIVFTSELDPMDGSWGPEVTQQWGGLIVLGNAPLNSVNSGTNGDFTADPQVATVDNIEGLNNSVDNDWTEYGGLDEEDSSGIIRYVSIRHGGALLGSNNEINGLTMGGVGRGTIVEFVEVFANKDDGFEWFGGTVDARYLVAAFGNDDSFDYDLGWRGRGQFWFSIGTTGEVTDEEQDHAGEHDGFKDTLVAGADRGMGTIYNATYIGAGATQNEGAFEISDDAGVRYYNSIFMDFGGHGMEVKGDALAGLTDVEDGVTRVDFQNNIWFNLGDGTAADLAVVFDGDNVDATASANVVSFLTTDKNNTIEDPMLMGVSRTADMGLDPRPMAGSPAFSNATVNPPADGWYQDVDYQGAFGSRNWMMGWTKLSQDGYLAALNGASVGGPSAISSVLTTPVGGVARSGFVVGGDVPQLFVIRAKGPKLVDDGIAAGEVLADPQMRIVDRVVGVDVVNVTGWLDVKDAADAIGAYLGLATLGASEGRPTEDATSAVAIVSLSPGVYSAVVSGEDNGGGTVQVEIYSADL